MVSRGHRFTVAIILSRMGSSRLPGKALVEIGGRPSLELMISRARKALLVDRLTVATASDTANDPIEALCTRLGIAVHRGDEWDVLGRFRDAAEVFQAETVVRLSGDCPIIDPGVIDGAIAMFDAADWDYAGNGNVRTFPDGQDVEVMCREVVEEAHLKARDPWSREHVTPYIRGKHDHIETGDFKVGDYLCEADFGHVRWTLDTSDDLRRLRRIVDLLPEGFSWRDALSVATRQPDLLGLRDCSISKGVEG